MIIILFYLHILLKIRSTLRQLWSAWRDNNYKRKNQFKPEITIKFCTNFTGGQQPILCD